MPLRKGAKSMGYNIKELSSTGRPKAQVLAIALKQARKTKAGRKKVGPARKGA